MTKLTIQNSALQKQVEELNTKDKTQLQTALQLIVNQTDTFEDELAFLKRKNQEIEQDIAEQDLEHARKMAELNTRIQ